MNTLIIVATETVEKIDNLTFTSYKTVIIFGNSEELPDIEKVGRFENEPELQLTNYEGLEEFAKLKYMEYFDVTDDGLEIYTELIKL